MFDGKIDFMDFNKIKINYGGKLTCRKIFKRKYLIFLIISIILLIFVVTLYSIKNNKIKGISIEIKSLINQQEKLENSITLLTNQNSEEKINLNTFQKDLDSMNNDILELIQKEEIAKNINAKNTDEKIKLEKSNKDLTSKLKTETELKEVYLQKISSLNNLLESLKIEYEKLRQHNDKDRKEENENLNIKNSKIISLEEASKIEKIIKGNLSLKCFDSLQNDFNPNFFHQNCNNSPLLVLIKTDKNERIGGFTKLSFDGFEIKRDISSALFNIDKNKFYILANDEYYTIVCDPNELPQFGYDLKIKKNGQGINSFPFNYGDKVTNEHEDLTKNTIFEIQNLEIYKVELL